MFPNRSSTTPGSPNSGHPPSPTWIYALRRAWAVGGKERTPGSSCSSTTLFDNLDALPGGYSYQYLIQERRRSGCTLAGTPYYYPLATRNFIVSLELGPSELMTEPIVISLEMVAVVITLGGRLPDDPPGRMVLAARHGQRHTLRGGFFSRRDCTPTWACRASTSLWQPTAGGPGCTEAKTTAVLEVSLTSAKGEDHPARRLRRSAACTLGRVVEPAHGCVAALHGFDADLVQHRSPVDADPQSCSRTGSCGSAVDVFYVGMFTVQRSSI